MRPPGGYTPDMMNYANDIDVYQIWADMVCFDRGRFDPGHRPYCCMYAARRRGSTYAHTHEDIYERFGQSILMYEEMPEVLSGAMGNFAYMARFPSEEEALAFAEFVLKKG